MNYNNNAYMSMNTNPTPSHQPPSEAAVKLFIGGLPKDSSEPELYKILTQHAAILNIELKRRKNKRTNKCLGHGIITTDLHGSQLLLGLKHFEYKGRTVAVSPYLTGDDLRAHQSNFGTRRLFVRGVPTHFKERDLRHTFRTYGALESCYFRKEPGTESKVAVVIFDRPSAAKSAVEDLQLLKKRFGVSMTAAFTFGEFKGTPRKFRGSANPDDLDFSGSQMDSQDPSPSTRRRGDQVMADLDRSQQQSSSSAGNSRRLRSNSGARSPFEEDSSTLFPGRILQSHRRSLHLDPIEEERAFQGSDDYSQSQRNDTITDDQSNHHFSFYNRSLGSPQENTSPRVELGSQGPRVPAKAHKTKRNLPWSARGRSIFYPQKEPRKAQFGGSNIKHAQSSSHQYNKRQDGARRENRIKIRLSKKVELEFHNIRPVEGRYASAPTRSFRLLENHDNTNLQLNVTSDLNIAKSNNSGNDYFVDYRSQEHHHNLSHTLSQNLTNNHFSQPQHQHGGGWTEDADFEPSHLLHHKNFARKTFPSRESSSRFD